MKGILRRTLLGAALTAATLSGIAAPALAEYPDRPVKFIYGFPPGDIDELLMRMIADKMTEMTGVPAAVIDKPGGAASVAAVSVLEQPADGATVGGFALSVPIVHPLRGHEVLKKDSFEPVAIFLSYPMILVTKSDNPFNNFAELTLSPRAGCIRMTLDESSARWKFLKSPIRNWDWLFRHMVSSP